MKFILITIALFTLVIGTGVYLTSTNQKTPSQPNVLSLTDTTESNPEPSPTPYLFQDLTIPGLKNRTYQSQIINQELVSQNNSYSSFQASYNSDGLNINTQLTIPNSTPPEDGFPAVVFVHGYIPPQRYSTFGNYASYVDYLAARDIIVFKIDLRGHADSEGEASGAYYSGDYVIDTLNAYSALQNHPLVDPNRIGLWGHSMAGNVIFRAMAAKPEIPKVVIWAGAVYTYQDFSDFRIKDSSYQPPPQESQRQRDRDLLFETYGRFDPNSDFWRQVPATNYLADIQGSLQIHHAIDDTVVDIGYSRNLTEILDNTTIPHQLFEYTTGGHNLTGSTFTQAMSRTADFLKQ